MITDSAVPGICIRCGVSTGDEVEPDARNYHCDECDTDSVYSPLVLLGLI